MTKKEMVEKNIGMTFDFIRFLVEHPETIKQIPDNAELQFIDKDFPIKEEKTKSKQVAIYRVGHVFEPI
jgi:hypothetical protein